MSAKASGFQDSLFSEPNLSSLLHACIHMPKVDLHRHLTGSIDAIIALRIAADFNVDLPTYILAELEQILRKPPQPLNYSDYFSTWKVLNRLFVSKPAIKRIILDVIRKAYDDGVIYLELRMGPRGFLGNDSLNFQTYLQTIKESIDEAGELLPIKVNCILGIPRHVFIKIERNARERMFHGLINAIGPYVGRYFVGVDLNGTESTASPSDFSLFFDLATEAGLSVTIHAGEVGDSSAIESSIDKHHADRIGHGLSSLRDADLLKKLSQKNIPLEICPSSNVFFGIFKRIKEVPLTRLDSFNVPYVICTDNPTRCTTSMSQELFKLASVFHFCTEDLTRLMRKSIQHCFADDQTKNSIYEKLDRWANSYQS